VRYTHLLVAALGVVALVAAADPAAAQTVADSAVVVTERDPIVCPIECTGTGPFLPDPLSA